MKSNRSFVVPTHHLPLAAAVALGLAPASSFAADITLTASDGFGSSSFDSGNNWPGAGAPTSSNKYFTGNFILRTPANAASYTFAGDSLTVNNTNGYPQGLFYKGDGSTAVITINDLILDGGMISHGQGPTQIFNLDGNITVLSDSQIYAKQGPINVLAPISGSASLTNPGSDKPTTDILTLQSASSTFSGNFINNGVLVLADDAVFNFVASTPGVNNSLSGNGPTTLNGDFIIDTSTASSTLDDQWNLVTNTSTTYGSTFTVAGWNESSPGVWWDPSETWRFTTADGILLVAPPEDSDNDGIRDLWEDQHFGNNDGNPTPAELALQSGTDDGYPVADGDFLNNIAEEANGTDPNLADSDSDGLLDGPEILATLNNGTTPTGFAATNPLVADSDNDGANDHEEVTGSLNLQFANAPTDPNNSDSDADGMPDGYELTCNSTQANALDPNDDGSDDISQAPSGDRDGDNLTNIQEFDPASGPNLNSPPTRADLADTDADGYNDRSEDSFGAWGSSTLTGTNPVVPDTDGDGLLDGQEDADLGSFQGAGVTPAWSDPNIADTDGDQFADGYEVITAGTDPNDNGSTPTQPAGWNLVEDFEGTGMTIGQSFKDLNGWQSEDDPSGMLVADEPIAGSDQIGVFLRPTGGNNLVLYKSLSSLGLQILDGNTGTIFLQVHATGSGLDHSLGLSDDAVPTFFSNFEAQSAFLGATPTLVARDGGIIRSHTGGGYRTGAWMNVWIVADNLNDEIKVYVESPDGESGQIDITPDSASDPYGFRNGLAANALTTFLMVENAAAAPALLIDNLYVDPSAANLTTPAANKPVPVADPRITDVFFDGGDLKITFRPGGTGYILTSSDDLALPFTEETGATYDGTDTFTVPAASLNPGKDFFRIEQP